MSFVAGTAPATVAAGRYALFHGGRECGSERWRLESTPEGWVLAGEQELVAPHPIPSVQEYRATISREWRPRSLEIRWLVGEHVLLALHEADGDRWRVRIDYGGQVKEQEGDFPASCEVDYGTHLFNMVLLARRDFQVGGEHEFPVLRIGPPWMAVTPHRMLYRCTDHREFDGPLGAVPAKRYVVTVPPAPEEYGYSFWADEDGFVLESYEGLDASRPWMKLVEYRRGA